MVANQTFSSWFYSRVFYQYIFICTQNRGWKGMGVGGKGGGGARVLVDYMHMISKHIKGFASSQNTIPNLVCTDHWPG